MKLNRRLALWPWCLMMLLFNPLTAAEVTIAVVGKTKNDSFYEQSYKGCQRFAREHPELNCIYDGADDYQDVRTQALIVRELVKQQVDGIMVSTTDSAYLTNRALKYAKQQNIPVITFDSDLLEPEQAYRLAYVGTNNFEFGKALGEAAKIYKTTEPQPICIQSGHQTTPNLNKRISGVRQALSGQSTERLSGASGWIEHARCPLYTMGRREDAITQLNNLLAYPNPPIFIAVAGFAQFHPNYIERMQPFHADIAKQEKIIISADTEKVQLAALKQQLSTINIGQNPFEMGRLGAELLYDVIKHGTKPKQEKYYLDFHYCNSKNSDTCTVNY
ncbi:MULTISPECIES: substrate-binding domain-containing protein [unclassified Pseudoalteromonas]|uniref:substrate-binding domain-containing protein n=1 Tax=unclassified Pseudoalteromonas TaxID=194690 RepID=UPI0030154BA0